MWLRKYQGIIGFRAKVMLLVISSYMILHGLVHISIFIHSNVIIAPLHRRWNGGILDSLRCLSVRLSIRLHVVGLFILKDVRQSLEHPCALRVLRTSWFSRFISDSITWDMLLENDGKFGEVINGTDIRPDSTHLSLYDILVQAPSRAGFCTGNWSSLSLPVQTCIMLWVCSY